MRVKRLKQRVLEITDPEVRENFLLFLDEIDNNFVNFEGKLVEETISSSVVNQQMAHNLRYRPKDIIITSTDGNDVWINHDLTTATYYFITTTGAVTYRALVGKFTEIK